MKPTRVLRPQVRPDNAEPEDSQFVHDEIRQLAKETKEVLQKHFQRHATNEEQVTSGILRFGPSAQSKLMLGKEKEAAEYAVRHDTYVCWRNESAPKSSRDFCCRVGPSHKCFCSHSLADHDAPRAGRRGQREAPKCLQCPCKAFQYVPNEPEEIGEHWISRRKDFVPGSWSPKCRCTHGAVAHDAVSKKCTQCRGCFQFEPQYACLVCDGKHEDHFTVFETSSQRDQMGLPTGPEFFPLVGQSPEVLAAVFGSQRIEEDLTQRPSLLSAPRVRDRTLVANNEAPATCVKCGSPFKSVASKFCSLCGCPRQ